MNRLPRNLEDLRGLRAARWIRESTPGQFDRYGPDSQRDRQTEFLERWGLVDTGLEYAVSASGRTVWKSPAMAAMIADAQDGAFDVLLVGYFDRWQRNTRRTLELVEDRLHPAGVAWVMCDRRLLSSDPRDWREMRRLASEAEEYSEKLGERITDGLEAKWRRHADQAGQPPLGFRRSAEPPHVLEIDPATIGQAVAVFRRYAEGGISTRELARETGIGYEQVAKMIRNPLYNGWVRRHRGRDEQRAPAGWRAHPPVDDELWRRVEDVREGRRHGGGRPRPGSDLLRGLVVCAHCSARIRSNGTMGNGRRQRIHPDPCPSWTGPASIRGADLDDAVAGQLSGIRLDEPALARVRAVVESTAPQPADTTKARLRRRLRDLALEHAAGDLRDEEYLTAVARLREDLAEADAPRGPRVDADAAIAAIEGLAARWALTTPEERARFAHLVYARIPVDGPRIRPVELTPWAYDIGLDQALPEMVRLEWRPQQDSNLRPTA